MPRKKNKVVPKLDMETPSLANIEYFEWKRQIENAKDDPAKLREIEEQQAHAMLQEAEQLYSQYCTSTRSPLITRLGGFCSPSSSPPIAAS